MSSSVRLYVGGMTGKVTPQDLQSTFGQFGKVTQVQDVGHKGFSYVQMEETDDARIRKLIFSLNSTKFRGKVLKLEVAKPDYLQVLKERQKKDKKDEDEKKERLIAKLERRNKCKVLPPTKPSSITRGMDTDDFVPSHPHGWVKVRGRYLPIMRVAKKGREGGVLLDPKQNAHAQQNILCYVKDIRINNILTELRPNTIELDQEHREAKIAEVDRWAHGLIRQRKSTDKPIDEEWQRTSPSQQTSRNRISNKPSNRQETFDDDFEVVSDSEDAGSNSFSDSDTSLDIATSSTTKKAKDSIKAKKTTKKSGKSDKSSMLSVIDSILKRKTGSDYGDSDSQDFELDPTSGESSEEEANGDRSHEDENHSEQEDDASGNDSDSLSAASFDAENASQSSVEGQEKGVVDFDSDEDEAPKGNGMDVDSSAESINDDESYSGDEDNESDGDDEEDEEAYEGRLDSKMDVNSDEQQASDPSDNESSLQDREEESYADSSDSSDSSGPPMVKIPESFKNEESDDDDVQLHIITTQPNKQVEQDSEEDSVDSEEEGAENGKKRSRVWSADTAPANKKFAYHELVREEDEKIFSLLRDAPDSQDKGGFKFLPNRKSEPSTVTALPAFLSGSGSAPAAGSSLPAISIDFPPTKEKKEKVLVNKDKMFLFGAPKPRNDTTSPSQGLSTASSSNVESPNLLSSTSRGFVRQSRVDQVHKLWSGTKEVHKQMAQKRHKVASKRATNNKRKF